MECMLYVYMWILHLQVEPIKSLNLACIFFCYFSEVQLKTWSASYQACSAQLSTAVILKLSTYLPTSSSYSLMESEILWFTEVHSEFLETVI